MRSICWDAPPLLGVMLNRYWHPKRIQQVTKNKKYFSTWSNTPVLLDTVPKILNLTANFPTFDDFSGAVFALADLQVAYKLNITQFAQGEVQLGSSSTFMSAKGLNGSEFVKEFIRLL